MPELIFRQKWLKDSTRESSLAETHSIMIEKREMSFDILSLNHASIFYSLSWKNKLQKILESLSSVNRCFRIV